MTLKKAGVYRSHIDAEKKAESDARLAAQLRLISEGREIARQLLRRGKEEWPALRQLKKQKDAAWAQYTAERDAQAKLVKTA